MTLCNLHFHFPKRLCRYHCIGVRDNCWLEAPRTSCLGRFAEKNSTSWGKLHKLPQENKMRIFTFVHCWGIFASAIMISVAVADSIVAKCLRYSKQFLSIKCFWLRAFKLYVWHFAIMTVNLDHSGWSNSDQTTTFTKMYFFNCTNHLDVMHDQAKPLLKQVWNSKLESESFTDVLKGLSRCKTYHSTFTFLLMSACHTLNVLHSRLVHTLFLRSEQKQMWLTTPITLWSTGNNS